MQNECELEFILHCAFGMGKLLAVTWYPTVFPCYTEIRVSCSYTYVECNVQLMHNVSNMLNVMLYLHVM